MGRGGRENPIRRAVDKLLVVKRLLSLSLSRYDVLSLGRNASFANTMFSTKGPLVTKMFHLHCDEFGVVHWNQVPYGISSLEFLWDGGRSCPPLKTAGVCPPSVSTLKITGVGLTLDFLFPRCLTKLILVSVNIPENTKYALPNTILAFEIHHMDLSRCDIHFPDTLIGLSMHVVTISREFEFPNNLVIIDLENIKSPLGNLHLHIACPIKSASFCSCPKITLFGPRLRTLEELIVKYTPEFDLSVLEHTRNLLYFMSRSNLIHVPEARLPNPRRTTLSISEPDDILPLDDSSPNFAFLQMRFLLHEAYPFKLLDVLQRDYRNEANLRILRRIQDYVLNGKPPLDLQSVFRRASIVIMTRHNIGGFPEFTKEVFSMLF